MSWVGGRGAHSSAPFSPGHVVSRHGVVFTSPSPLPSQRSELTSTSVAAGSTCSLGGEQSRIWLCSSPANNLLPSWWGRVGRVVEAEATPSPTAGLLFWDTFLLLFCFCFCRSGRPLTVRLSVKNHDQAHGFFKLYILKDSRQCLAGQYACAVWAACCCEARRLSALGRLLVTTMSPCAALLSCLDSTTPPVPFGVCRCGCRLLQTHPIRGARASGQKHRWQSD